MENQEVTIYATSEFFGSVVKYCGKLVEHGTRKYAQYENVPFVKFIPKGKRKIIHIQKSYKPSLITVKGYNTPDPQGMFGETVTKNGVSIKESLYSSRDDNYKKDFDEILINSNVEIIADYRAIDKT